MKSWDAVIIGGGVIGLTTAFELSKRSRRVLVIDRTEPGTEASHAAAGMLAHCDPHTHELLIPLAASSARLYPELVLEQEDETGLHIDLRREGAIAFFPDSEKPLSGSELSAAELARLEPALAQRSPAYFMPEASLDPRCLVQALTKSLHHRRVDIATGSAVVSVEMSGRKATGVRTDKSHYAASVVINCAGAWASRIAPVPLRTRPVKGQMLSVVPPHGSRFPLRHVVRSSCCYLVPRTDGRIVIGSTLEEAGFDKRVDPNIIQGLHQSAANLLPEIGQGRILEAWAGLRPGSPDSLPMIGETSYGGYLVATGHYRDGILLAPVTAQIVAKLAVGETPETNLLPFSPERFC